MSSFVVVAIFKNETTSLQEWIDHYIWQGATHIYMGDNGSTDNPLKILQPYIDSGYITYIPYPGTAMQVNFYRFMTKKIQELTNPPEWTLIADLDEYWFGQTDILQMVLSEYSDTVDVIYRQWREFGPSEDGFQPKSLRKELIYRNPEETSPKFIFRTLRIKPEQIWIHEIREHSEDYVIREKEKLHCHHYHCQSLEHYMTVRIPRGYVMGDLNVYSVNIDESFHKRGATCTLKDINLADRVYAEFEEKVTS
jgi:hypothetical protein